MADKIQFRRDTASRWSQYNPVLMEGEVGYETDSEMYKVGDGVSNWNQLEHRGLDCLQVPGDSKTSALSQRILTNIFNNSFVNNSLVLKNAQIIPESESTNGILLSDGTLNTNFNVYKTYTFENSNAANIYLYINAVFSGTVAEKYVNVVFYEKSTDLPVVSFNLYGGKNTIAFRRYFYVKITVLQGTVVSTSTEVENLQDTQFLISQEINDIYNSALGYKTMTGVKEAVDGYYHYQTGVFVPLNSYKSEKYDINPNLDYYVTATVNGGPICLAVFLDENGQYLGYSNRGENGQDMVYDRQKLTIPVKTKYLCLTGAHNVYSTLEQRTFDVVTTDECKSIVSSEISQEINDLKINSKYLSFVEKYSNLSKTKENINIAATDGYYNNTTGLLTPFNGYKSSELIEISSDKVYFVSCSVNGSITALVIYLDENYALLGYEGKGTNSKTDKYLKQIISPPDNAKYIGLTTSPNTGLPELYSSPKVGFTQFDSKQYTDDSLINASNTNKSIGSYHFIRENLDLDGDITEITEYEVGAMRSNGILDVSKTSYRVYTVKSSYTNNSFVFIKAKQNGNLPICYCTLMILNEDTDEVVEYFRLHGEQIVAIQKGYYAKITQRIDFGVYASTSVKSVTDIVSKNSQEINDIYNSALGYKTMTGVKEAVDGYYHYQTGVFVPLNSYKSEKYDINPNLDYYVTATVNGGPICLAVFLDENGQYLGYSNRGENGQDMVYDRQKLTIPVKTKYLCLTGAHNVYSTLEQRTFDVVTTDECKSIVSSEISELDLKHWNGKKIVWFGTSIPAGGYPQIVGQLLRATMYNEALGCSMARRGKIDQTDGYGWTGLAWQNVAYAMSQTIAEKNELINNWDTWKTKLSNTPPSTLTQSQKDFFLSCSYEQKLIKYLKGGSVGQVDLYVFDHGHNDNLSSDTDEQFTSVPSNKYDRNTFIGAMNYLINIILEDNPRAKIIIISHYENDRKSRIVQAQNVLSEYWDFPFIQYYKNIGFTQKTVKTTGYWQDGYWVESGGGEQTLTMTKIWMADDLHPHSDKSGTCNNYLANNLASLIDLVR